MNDLAILERLIGFDTVSAKSNLDLIDWVADYLDHLGIAVRLTHNPERTKANLYATIGPASPGGVVLSGHTDVVPVAGQDWASDPFRLTRRGDRLYGRGTADMKGFIALALARVPQYRDRLRQVPIHLALSFDEEVGCGGVRHLLHDLPNGASRPVLAIIGEPTSMLPVNAHKGVEVFSTIVTGLDGHSSAPHRAVNAITAASAVISVIDRIARRLAAAGDAHSPFDPPYSTVNIGTIHGGTAQNIVPAECRFTWEIRGVPGQDIPALLAEIGGIVDAEILPPMRRIHPDASIVTSSEIGVPGLSPEPEGAAEALVRRLTGANHSGTVAFASEAGLFQQSGLSAVLCGPGSIDQAHKPDEYLEVAQFAAGGQFLDRLGDWVAQQTGL